ncbi:hypothetical protein BGZ68_007331 [Mortierella alpina]|nr:hypothetical protein BGZ68_007331 [Mortierella alpina]
MFNWSPSFSPANIKLGERIGLGAQAEIFKAKYGRTGIEEVVVKQFLNSKNESIEREINIIQQVTHRNIVQFYHVHHNMIVMEYIEGGNLAEAIVNNSLKSWEVKTQIAKDISLGLAYLHSVGIIHCDIKSPNILLTEHKEAKICDFGLAMKVGESDGKGGTLQWMAPELLQTPPLYTGKSDMYALGMVMWEMASGSTQPYREHTPDGIMNCIIHGILEECPDSTPKAYADCVQMCWMLDADKRPCARDVLPDVVQLSSELGAPEQQKSIANKSNMDHYVKALRKHGPDGLMIMVKIGNILRDTKTMDWFDTSAVGRGPAKAMLKIGTMYYSGGSGVQVNYGDALEWYLAASEAGVAVAMLKISQMYACGHGVEKDDKEAISWFCKGEEAVKEQGRLNNRIVHHDSGVSEHHTRTMEWFSKDIGGERAYINCQIGKEYYQGGDLEQDHDKAMDWFLKASDTGDTDAMSYIGVMYEHGEGVEQDYGKAMEWFLKASEAGNVDAMRLIGVMHDQGHGVEQDYGKAMEWFLKASEAGSVDAMRLIGVMHNQGHGVEQDYDKALEWYSQASDAGDPTAKRFIGVMYRNGHGVEQDYNKAMEWYFKASDAGDTTTNRYIGHMYEHGQGVEQDYNKAMEWYLKASDAGDTIAMRNIGDMYHDGEGVEQDHSTAMGWFLKASDAGDATAKFSIGTMYYEGEGVEQDPTMAMEWLLKASDSGDASAMCLIGLMHENGQGVEEDYGKAMEWLLKAVDGGNVVAMVSLGDMYQAGHGVDKDYSKAMDWYLKASCHGNASAMRSIGYLYRDAVLLNGIPRRVTPETEKLAFAFKKC